MEQQLSLRIGNFLYNYAYPLYKPVYFSFKRRQDAAEISFIKKLVKPGNTVLDIGANIGFYSTLLCDLVGNNGKVISFEADRLNFKRLEKNMEQFNNIELHHVAVSDKEGELLMYVSHRLNVDNRTYEPEKYKNSYKVKAVAIDDVINPGEKIDFIKMDIQGSEYLALKGMDRLITENPNISLLCEYAPDYLKECSGITPKQFYNFFLERGFELFFLRDGKLEQFSAVVKENINGDVYYENIIATAKKPEELIR
jgi:FkbM family methyltransferase